MREQPQIGRSGQSAPAATRDLEVLFDERLVLVAGRPLKLTPRETQILLTLARNPERVMTRDEIHHEVWGGDRPVRDRSVDVYTGRVRAKLAEAVPDRIFIHTHTGIGYRFSPTGDEY